MWQLLIFGFQDGSQNKTLMWQKIGSQGDEWKQGLLQMSPSQSFYQVRLRSLSFCAIKVEKKR